jgi:hypothetical protein
LRKEPGAGIDLYTRCNDTFVAPVGEPQDADPTNIHSETIYVSPAPIPHVPINKYLIHFRVESDADGPSRNYYYGGQVKTALSRQGLSEFEVGLETNGNTVVITHIGRFLMDAQNNLPKQQKEVYAVLGFSESRLWTGIHLDQEHGLESDHNVYPRLYTEFLNGIMAASTTVSTHWEGRVPGRTGRWLVKAGIHAEREIPGFPFYQALVRFSLSRNGQSRFKWSSIT